MKLAAKLILMFLFGVFVITAVVAWQALEQQRIWEQEVSEAKANQIVNLVSFFIQEDYDEIDQVEIVRLLEKTSNALGDTTISVVEAEIAKPANASSVAQALRSLPTGNLQTHSSLVALNVAGRNYCNVNVVQPLQHSDAVSRHLLVMTLIKLLLVAATAGVVIYFGGIRFIATPMNKLLAQVKSISEGSLDQQPVLRTKDELGTLAVALSDMSQKLREQKDTIRHINRLGTVGTLASGIAHELGTPLNVVSGQASLILGGRLQSADIHESATVIKQEAEQMIGLVRQLLDFARRKTVPKAVINLNETIRGTCEMMQTLAGTKNVQIHLEPRIDDTSRAVEVVGDAAQLQQVFTNLIGNAIEAMPQGGNVNITLSDDGERYVIAVADSGVGINQADLPKLFEPFFTTKDVGAGTGLGLSIVYGIVSEHGGEISVDSTPGKGSLFRVVLPKYQGDRDSRSRTLK